MESDIFGMQPFDHVMNMASCSVIGVGPRSIDMLPLARSGLLASSLTYEGHPWSALTDPPAVWTLEAEGRHRRNHWRPDDLAALATALLDELMSAEKAGRRVVLMPYSANRWHEKVVSECSSLVQLAANPRTILDSLHDKIFVRDALCELGVPVPKSLAASRADLRAGDIARSLGLPFVAQTRSGFAGKGTFLIHSESELDAALAERANVDNWLLSSYVGDLTINFAGVVTGSGSVDVAPPAVQLVDFDATSNGFGNYGGNDFAAAQEIDSAVLELGAHWTSEIGSWLAGRGFLGAFGVDYVVANDEINAIEINPRLQASSALLGEIELEHGVLPTAVRHLLTLLGEREIETEWPALDTVRGGQLALRDHGGGRIVTRTPQPGRYSISNGQLVFLGSADGLLECGENDVVVAGVSPQGTFVAHGATLARVMTHARLADSSGAPLAAARELATAVRAAFNFQPEPNNAALDDRF